MVNITAIKGSQRYNFIVELFGDPHTTTYNKDKAIGLWILSEDDKKGMEEIAKENQA